MKPARRFEAKLITKPTKVVRGMQNKRMPKSAGLDHDQIRRIAITAVFSDDFFFEKVVLKGGNALALALGMSGRTSLDLDFSIENDFDDVAEAERRLLAALERRFWERKRVSAILGRLDEGIHEEKYSRYRTGRNLHIDILS
jgi:hypothetical protein